MKKDNKGFSLVELIIVIAVIGILGTMFIAGTGYVASSAARSLANSVKTGIGETRIKTMGKQETVFYFYKATDGKYYKQYLVKNDDGWMEPEPAELIGKHHPVVRYSEDGSTYTDMNAGDTGLLISFNRTNGKEKALSINGEYKNDGTGALVAGTGENLNSIECRSIVITGGGATCNIKIEPATGKVTFE